MLQPLFAVSWVDVGIPLVGGVLMLAFPQWVFKKTGCEETDAARQAKARKWGAILLVVATIYVVTTSQV